MSAIQPATLAAYRETDYRVFAQPAFTLHIGAPSEPLRALYRQRGIVCCAYLTACNPHSQPLREDENAARQHALAEELRRGGYDFLDGAGCHPQGDWTEPSFLVPGMPLDAAKALGERYGQNAIVWCGADAIPELVLLR